MGDVATAAVFDGLPLFCTLAFPASDFALFLGAGRAAGLAAVGVFFATDLAGLPFNAFVSFLIRPPLDGEGFFAAAVFLATGFAAAFRDRKSVVLGKSWAGRVDLGGCSVITKK